MVLLRAMARMADSLELKFPKNLQDLLAGYNEASRFVGNIMSYSLDRLAQRGTAEALSEVALQLSTRIGISRGNFRFLDDLAHHLIQTADPEIAREAFAIARRKLALPPYDPAGGREGFLDRKLRALATAN